MSDTTLRAARDVQGEAWTLLEREYDKLAAVCRRMVGGDRADEAMSEVVCEVLPRILRNFDETMGVPLMAKVTLDVKWYLYKWLRKRDTHKERYGCLDDALMDGECEEPFGDPVYALDERDSLRLVMSQLDEYDRGLIEMRLLGEKTTREMADDLGIANGSVHAHYTRALQRARELAREIDR